jgi:TRAP-type mannitol/chloroaromatic compound transport system permease small subunit
VGWLTLVLAVLAIIPLVFYSVHSKKINWIQVASVILALVPVVIIVALASNDLAKTIYKVGNGDNFAKLNGTGWVVFVIAILGIVASVAAIGLSSYSSYKNYKKGPSSSK